MRGRRTGPASVSPGGCRMTWTEADRAKALASVEKMICRAVTSSGLPSQEWDDAISDVRMRLWEVSARFDPAGASKFSTWAHLACKRFVAAFRDDHFRAPLSRAASVDDLDARVPDPRSLIDPDDGDDLDDAAGPLAAAVRRQLFAGVLADLGPGHRRLIEMVAFDGLTVGQVADLIGQPVKSVKTNLLNAISRLAAAGHVPADLAKTFGLDAAALAARADTPRVKATAKARRALVAEELARGRTTKQIAADLGEPVTAVQRDAAAIRRAARTPDAGPVVAV